MGVLSRDAYKAAGDENTKKDTLIEINETEEIQEILNKVG